MHLPVPSNIKIKSKWKCCPQQTSFFFVFFCFVFLPWNSWEIVSCAADSKYKVCSHALWNSVLKDSLQMLISISDLVVMASDELASWGLSSFIANCLLVTFEWLLVKHLHKELDVQQWEVAAAELLELGQEPCRRAEAATTPPCTFVGPQQR